MPIRPENRFFYPIDWAQLSDVIRLGRTKGCSEGCGRPHGQLVFHLGDGRWWDAAGQTWRSGLGRPLKLAPLECLSAGTAIDTTRVYLACAHLDNDPGNNAPKNLKALCQRCHILHDCVEPPRQLRFTYRHRKAPW